MGKLSDKQSAGSILVPWVTVTVTLTLERSLECSIALSSSLLEYNAATQRIQCYGPSVRKYKGERLPANR